MNQKIANDTGNRNDKSFHAVPVGVILTVCLFIGVSAFSLDGPVIVKSSIHPSSVWPIGPADSQVAKRHGRIDHSSLTSPDILLEPNPAPGASIAAYETPPP